MRLPNLLATRRGRLSAFFLLYVTEGIPLGFAATAVATQLRRQGVGPAEIGAFVGSFYLPWAFKWAFGPFVDVFWSRRLGRRRGWILVTQVLMVLTLLATVMLELPAQLGLLTAILLLHNTFAATQDVAIDALACNTLAAHERSTATGWMFAGASIGQTIGGAGALFVAAYAGFTSTFFFVSAAIAAVTILVVLPMREAPDPVQVAAAAGQRLRAAGREVRAFAVSAFRSFLGSRGAYVGLFMSMLPPGAMCLGLALQSNLAVELGMDDDAIARLNLGSTVISAFGCVIGGRLADRFDRRAALAAYIVVMTLPVLAMAAVLQSYGWIMPVAPDAANRPLVAPALLSAFWIATLAYGFFNGMMYSASTAIYMDVTNPLVAASQYTAYMALANLAISYTATWQGIAIEAWGYPVTMLVDAGFGLLYLALLPFVRRLRGETGYSDERAAGRARRLAFGLMVACAAWIPVHAMRAQLGPARDILELLFTLVFVATAVFLLAGAALQQAGGSRLARVATWVSPLLMIAALRNRIRPAAELLGLDAGMVGGIVDGLMFVVPPLAAAVLWQLARRRWDALAPEPPAADRPAIAPAA